jgi:hypothetical protein
MTCLDLAGMGVFLEPTDNPFIFKFLVTGADLCNFFILVFIKFFLIQ